MIANVLAAQERGWPLIGTVNGHKGVTPMNHRLLRPQPLGSI